MAWPTSSNPRTQVVTLRLTEQEYSDLDALAAEMGVSRSEAVRSSLTTSIKRHNRRSERKTREPQ